MPEMDLILNKLRTFAEAESLLRSGDKILIALSGGADSSAMLVLLSKLRVELRLTLLAVHINHQLRGAESDEDELFCKELCLRFNVPLVIRKIEFPDRRNLENQARIRRYGILNQILSLYKFQKIATAHHKNDQAETILINLIRGAGINGLSGIKPMSENVIHPLLCFDKSELISMLRTEGIRWREDSSNSSSFHRRNIVRSKLIPLIEAELNPSFTDKICKQAEIYRKSDALIASISTKKLKKALIDQDAECVVLSIPDLLKLSDVERFYILRSVYARLVGKDIDFFSHSYEELIGICSSDGSKWTCLQNGIIARKQYDELHLCTGKSSIETTTFEAAEVEEERAFFVHMDHRFAFKHFKVMSEDLYTKSDPFSVVVDADKLMLPFRIRSRAPGDRFIPLGMKFHKKLKEFFIDEKVPKFERDMVPVLEDKEKLFWVVGHRIDERVKCDESTSHFLQITAERLNTGRKRPANRK